MKNYCIFGSHDIKAPSGPSRAHSTASHNQSYDPLSVIKEEKEVLGRGSHFVFVREIHLGLSYHCDEGYKYNVRTPMHIKSTCLF